MPDLLGPTRPMRLWSSTIALTLTSVYLAGALAAHLIRAPGRPPRLDVDDVDPDELPVTHARQRCLLNHAAALQRAAAQLTAREVTIDVPDSALTVAAQLF
ncbi:MAG: hypothetical protein H0X56_04225, partial [Solirubrobacterales bacterium]|nr:hypothetical protein [Solirubrobacterales bacterium]